jgi:hypothetical protein
MGRSLYIAKVMQLFRDEDGVRKYAVRLEK